MDPIVYLKALRRRWWLIALVTLLALGGAFLTLPTTNAGGPTASQYTATHTLLQRSDSTETINLPLIALFATSGQVPRIAAQRLGLPLEQGALLAASGLQVVPDPEVAALRITFTDPDPERAVAVADAFAEGVKRYLVLNRTAASQAEQEQLSKRLAGLQDEIRALGTRIEQAGLDRPLLEAELAVKQQNYQDLFARTEALADAPPAQSPFDTLQAAIAVPVLESTGPVPQSRTGRLGLAAVLGLLLGAGLALVLDRLDTKLRTREAVEEATGLPVVTEVPRLPARDRGRQHVVSAVEPDGAIAEAYRALRSALLLVPARPLVPADAVVPPLDLSTWSPPHVVLITSASPSDGKTSTAVNLASSLAESGRSVIVLDADFRKPAANTFLAVPHGPGLSDLLSGSMVGGVPAALRDTAVPGVRLVTSGSSTRHPAALLARFGDIVEQAKRLADVVVVDSAPLLVANDATDIVPHVDAVLVVAHAGKSTRPQTERVVELLSRLAVPVLGVVLQASREVDADAQVGYYGERAARPARSATAGSTVEILPSQSYSVERRDEVHP